MKKTLFVLLVLMVMIVLSGCQSKLTHYRMFKDQKYIETSDNFYEYEASWMRIEDITGGYKIIYSSTSIYTEVKDNESVVYGLTCQLTRSAVGTIQTDCNENDRLQLLAYLDATVLYESGGEDAIWSNPNISLYIGLIVIGIVFDVFFGLMAFHRPFLEALFQFKAMLKFQYKSQPEYSEMYLDVASLIYKILFIILACAIVVGSIMIGLM